MINTFFLRPLYSLVNEGDLEFFFFKDDPISMTH